MADYTPEDVSRRLKDYECDPVEILVNCAKEAAYTKDRIQAAEILLRHAVPKDKTNSDTLIPYEIQFGEVTREPRETANRDGTAGTKANV